MKLINELLTGKPGDDKSQRIFIVGTASLLLLVVVAYLPTFRGDFIWDDPLVIFKNPLVTGRFNLLSIWFHTDFPLSMIAFWLEWLAWGKNPVGYHIVNVLLHALGSFLVWRVLARLKIPGCWLAAAIFAVHPVSAASVAWISELKNTLSLPFFLLSLYFYIRFQETLDPSQALGNESRRSTTSETSPVTRYRWYCGSLAAFLLALLTKTTTAMLPVVLLGVTWWQRRRLRRQDWFCTTPFFILAIAFGISSIWFQSHQAFTTATVQTENFWGRLAGAGMAFWFYLGKALFPIHLNMIYPRWVISATRPMAYLPLLLAILLFGLCWIFRRGWGRHFLFALGYSAVTLFPALGFFDFYYLAISRVSDHLAYLSLIGVIALVAALAKTVLRRIALQSAGAALVLFFGFLTFQRSHVLAKDETLWRDTLAKNPAAWTAHNNLGCILAEQNKLGEAILQFIQSTQDNPKNAQAFCNWGKALFFQNKLPEAESRFQIALLINPRSADTHKSFASVLLQEGKTQEALAHLTEAVRLEPDASTRLELARLLNQLGRFSETTNQYRAVIATKPDSLEALNNLAWILATCPDPKVRNGPQAFAFAERACRLTNYKDTMPLGTLAAAYAEAGRFGDAIKAAEKSLQLATASGNTEAAQINRQLLTLYRAGRPYHEPKR